MNLILEHGLEILGAVTAILGGIYTISLIIPGDQPDKAIKAILDLTQKFSKK